MKYLLDTCVISELKKKIPDPKVVAWIDEVEEQTLFLSVLTIGELQKGISKLPNGERKKTLQEWVDYDLIDRFKGRIVSVDTGTAITWGMMLGESEREGVSLPVMDSLIAATAKKHGMVVVTRNESDLTRCKAKVFNPWSS